MSFKSSLTSKETDTFVYEYIHSAYPTPDSYDIIVVDDMYRNAVSRNAINFLKQGGIFILDDSEQIKFTPTIDMLNDLKCNFASFYGPAPYHFHEKQITLWFKPTMNKS